MWVGERAGCETGKRRAKEWGRKQAKAKGAARDSSEGGKRKHTAPATRHEQRNVEVKHAVVAVHERVVAPLEGQPLDARA